MNKETRYGNNKNDTLTLFSCFVREKSIVNRTSELIHNYITRLREQCSNGGTALWELRCWNYVVGSTLLELRCWNCVVGTALSELRCQNCVVGTALFELRCA